MVPFVVAACGGDDSTPSGGGASAGAGGSQSDAGKGGVGAGGSHSGAGKDGAGAGGRAGSAGTNSGGADACVPVAGYPPGVLEPLDDFCSKFYCPASIADAVAKTLDYCGNIFPPRVIYGCDRVTVDYSDFSGGTAYTFDSTTNEVVLISSTNDVPWGACNVIEYYYGELDASCPDAATCSPCADLRNDAQSGAGAAGFAGEIGAAGETGAAGVAGAGGAGTVPQLQHCPKF